MTAISARQLTHIYSPDTPFKQVALNEVSLDIEKGEFLGIIGHTGSGKSTLVQHFNGLLKPTSGTLLVDGEDIWKKGYNIREVRFKVGLVFQYPEYQLFEETVYKDIAFGPKNMGLSQDEIDSRVRAAAEFTGLAPELLERSPFELSGGQKRRAAIAGVMAMNPEVLILDEPAAGLDPKGRNRILNQIKDYHQKTGNTVLLVSHSMEDIARYSGRVLVMAKGRVYMLDEVAAIFARAEELVRTGLDLPELTKVLLILRDRGFNVNPAAYTPEDVSAELLRLKGGMAGC